MAESTKSHISIFEMGLGTGLNVLLSLEYISQRKNLSINYISIELHPLAESCWTLLDYNAAGDPKYFEAIHKAPWHIVNRISPNFTLEKKLLNITEYTPSIEQVDLIYYDAFGPGIQPALWTTATLQKMVDMLVPGGVFVTYCAKGEVRRILSGLGLKMERLPGPPGKREMLRGIKII